MGTVQIDAGCAKSIGEIKAGQTASADSVENGHGADLPKHLTAAKRECGS